MGKLSNLREVLKSYLPEENITDELIVDIIDVFEEKEPVFDRVIPPILKAYLEEHIDENSKHLFFGIDANKPAYNFFDKHELDFSSRLTTFYYSSVEPGNMHYSKAQEVILHLDAIIVKNKDDVNVYPFLDMDRTPKVVKAGVKKILKIFINNKTIGVEFTHSYDELKDLDFILRHLYKNHYNKTA